MNLTHSTFLGCTYKPFWCRHAGAFAITFGDCDGDGIADPICRDSAGKFGAIESGNNCAHTYPSGTCKGNCLFSKKLCILQYHFFRGANSSKYQGKTKRHALFFI